MYVTNPTQVTHKKPDPDWFMKGGLDDVDADAMMEEDDGNHFFYQKWFVLRTVCDIRELEILRRDQPRGRHSLSTK